MKNIFKSLMLVAVAAMGFTACEKDNNDVNQTEQKVVLEFTAGFAEDTRVAFGDADIDNHFPTKWEAGDVITIQYAGKTATCTLTAEDIANEGAAASIKAEFSLGAGETLPASGVLTATVGGAAPEVQDGTKPAHSLKAVVDYPSSTLTFEHQVAYGKVSIVGLPADFDLTKVDLKLSHYWYDYLESETISINTTSATDIWFTTEAMEVVSFVISATDSSENVYSKEVVIGANPLNFVVGEVSIFSVSDLDGGAVVIDGALTDAVATLGTEGGDTNYHTVTFTRNDGATLAFELRTEGKDFLKVGNYTPDWGSYNSGAYEGYINYARFNGEFMYVTDLAVTYSETEQYIVTFTYDGVEYIYTGAIENLTAPKALILSETSLSFEAEGGSSTITVTTSNITGAISVTSSYEQFTATLEGNTITVVAGANETSKTISGTITVTCDTLTVTVAVKQKGQEVSGAVQDGTQANPYIFTCSVSTGNGYYVLDFTCDANNTTLYMESNTDLVSLFSTGAINADHNWYPISCVYNSSSDADWANSHFTIESISANEICLSEMRIRLQSTGEDIYYRCDSVVFP